MEAITEENLKDSLKALVKLLREADGVDNVRLGRRVSWLLRSL